MARAVISYVKPHGALYNQAAKMKKIARLIAQTVYQFDPNLKLMGLAGSLMLRIAEEEKLQTISEVFADRHYMPDGSLVLVLNQMQWWNLIRKPFNKCYKW